MTAVEQKDFAEWEHLKAGFCWSNRVEDFPARGTALPGKLIPAGTRVYLIIL